MRLFGHRFSVSPMFWVIWILGCLTYPNVSLLEIGSWILAGILFGSIIISMFWHELGHIIFHRIFGGRNLDTLFGAYGGRTESDASFSRFQKVVVNIAGPIFSLLLAIACLIYLQIWPPQVELAETSIKLAMTFNVVWALLNLVPILPLDGGKLMVGFYPGTKKMLLILGLLLSIVAVAFCLFSLRWVGAFLFVVIGYVNINLLLGRKV